MSSNRARRARRAVRSPWAAAGAIVVVFCTLLALWTSGLSGSGAVVVPPIAGLGATPIAEGPVSAGATDVPGEGGTSGSGSTDASPKLPGIPKNSTYTFAPGTHAVTVTATGDLGLVAYVFKGQKKLTKTYNVRSPFRLTQRVSGVTNLAALGIQIPYNGKSATCSVSVDGTVVVTYTVHGPYEVVGCVV